MKTLLETLTSGYDLVLLDTPPVLGAADPIVLAAMVDGALVVVRAGHTSREAAQHAIGQLERVGARVLGAVLNDPDAIAARYGRPYGYGYGYAYATDD
jgi:Mrp family chromosome partitioning ATPase